MEVRNPVDVCIAGAGPIGTALAIELGRWGVRTVLAEREAEPGRRAIEWMLSLRTMEHFRRMGIAERIRVTSGIDPEGLHPQDAVYCTGFRPGRDFLRLRHPPRMRADPHVASSWQSPACAEAAQRTSHRRMLPVLWEVARSQPSVDVRFGVDALSVMDGARFRVACDGAGSGLRTHWGIQFQDRGEQVEQLKIHFRAPRFLAENPLDAGIFYYIIRADHRGLLMPTDGDGSYTLHIQGDGPLPDPEAVLRLLIPVPFEILETNPWRTHHRVADRFACDSGFLVGDAAHVMTPVGGFGANTGFEDVANLGWKLAAVVQGWGGPRLLSSYQAERRPAACRTVDAAAVLHRRLRVVSGLARSIPLVLAAADGGGRLGRRLRVLLGASMPRSLVAEYDTHGVMLGQTYSDSPVLPRVNHPAWRAHRYVPSTQPGCRCPHVVLEDGRALADALAHGFVCLSTDRAVRTTFMDAGRSLGIPLSAHAFVPHPTVARAFGTMSVLVRPDQVVCWRGTSATPSDADAALELATGRD